ncbi:OmpA family protein [Treponema sp. OMZ 906]|uniref:OmpA family protein n=1 Tax=Treponema sp. OMZ 906 TaxID=2563662 RepID=UPI0020A57FFD|nr:OmpA family protein [Treponema sp. OMZ 906]UTC55809.1 OmpA family protein [Treponema sp. OMZ 906]
MKRTILSIVCVLIPVIAFTENGRITISERADYSVYKNDTYAGLTYREAYIYLDEKATVYNDEPAYRYEGEAFVLEETRKNMVGTAKKLDEIRPIAFTQSAHRGTDGTKIAALHFTQDTGYPLLRNFPTSPTQRLEQQESGKKWTAESTIVVCPQQGKNPTRIPVLAEYQYIGKKKYNGTDTHYVKAVFALRYHGEDHLGDADMLRSEGSRTADIYLDDRNRPLFIREKIDETFFYKGAESIRQRGFLLHFYNYGQHTVYNGGSVPTTALLDHSKNPVKPESSNKERIKDKGDGIFNVQETPRGILLNLKNLHFVADKAELLHGEDKKLDEIAAVLKTLTFKNLFVEGHTADVGDKSTQHGLSLRRAKTVVDELTKRGIPSGVFIYSGAGGSKPIASNTTEAERALNRRVEITIME